MRFAIESIGPERAKALLAKNVKNRPLNSWTVEKYSMEMSRGSWAETGDTVKISKTGKLIDGQHRLEAVVKCGLNITFAIAYDVPDESFDSVDIGRGRKPSDLLAMQGHKHYTTIASAARLLYLDEKGLLDHTHPSLSGKSTQSKNVSNRDVLVTVEACPDLAECAKMVGTTYRFAGQLLNYGLAAYILYKCRLIDESAADKFFSGLTDGIGLHSESPVHMLRERLVRNQADKRKLERRELYAFAVKAWNAFRSNSVFTHSRLRLRTTGPGKETNLVVPQ